uniref:Uncharacterized protein n=1 Tax=Rhodnius prolixus TaxID=13249 RepID=T1HL40_RHOPR
MVSRVNKVIVLLAALAVTMTIASGQTTQSSFDYNSNSAFASGNANLQQGNLDGQIGGNNNAPLTVNDDSGFQGSAGPSASAGGQGGQNGGK